MGREVRFAERRWHRLTRLRRQEMFCRCTATHVEITVCRPWKRRHVDVAALIADAADLLGKTDIPPFYVNTGDKPFFKSRRSRTRFSACECPGSADVAAPDFAFGVWPEARYDDFDATCAAVAAAGAGPPSEDRAVWLGRALNASRLAAVALSEMRPDLILAKDLGAHYDHDRHAYKDTFLSLDEQAKRYRYFVDIEGSGYSGRLKLLLHSGRVVLLQENPWREYFLADLQPFRHFVPLRRDLSDLAEKLAWLGARPEREAEIAGEAKSYAGRHLTRGAAVAVWARRLVAHAEAGGRLTSGLEILPRPLG